MSRLTILLLTLLFPAVVLTARDTDSGEKPLRPVFAAYTVEYGTSHLSDTYLTPLKYDEIGRASCRERV